MDWEVCFMYVCLFFLGGIFYFYFIFTFWEDADGMNKCIAMTCRIYAT